jgi:3-oxoacyl-[acyl-carrier protein] reductase
MKLCNKIAIVTGAAQGIGKAISEVFASEGANVVISDINSELVKKTENEINLKYKVKTISFSGDITNFDFCNKLVKFSIEKFHKIDILVNNAGITKDNLVLRMSETDWDNVISVNLKGVFNCTKSVVKQMFKQKCGRIINISSVVGQIGNSGQINYSASKGGIIAMTKTCAKEFSSRNILVNAIAPGFIYTRMTDKLTHIQKEKIISQIPLLKLGSVYDIANAALFFACDYSSYITGQVLSVNGGMYM